MTAPQIENIPYQPDTADYFLRLFDLPQVAWLDSGRPLNELGRFDIISALPNALLTTTGSETHITTEQGTTCNSDNPFDLVDDYLQGFRSSSPESIPFNGGALGYFAYTLGNWLEKLPKTAQRDIDLPDMHVGIYSWSLIQDHERRQSCLVFLPQCPDRLKKEVRSRINDKAATNIGLSSFKIKELQSQIDVKTYTDAIDKIQHYIRAGDCYQVNFAQRFSSEYQGSPVAAYLRLRQVLPSPYSAFLSLDRGAILSHSPERFLTVNGRSVETKPIKGTRPRFKDPLEDKRSAQELLNSSKDRAENLMIVDLLRNDLSKNCDLNSVNVPHLFALESFPNVHHLVSTVHGSLKAKSSLMELFKGCFPGGSITGAPKVRAMQIIDELEPSARSVYCGSVGYFSANGNMDTNIAIRTLACDNTNHKIHCWGGGGIVADSDADEEYQESLTKVRVLLENL